MRPMARALASGVEIEEGLDVGLGALAPQVLGIGADAVDHRGGDRCRDLDFGRLEVLVENCRGRSVAAANVGESGGPGFAANWVVVDDDIEPDGCVES